MNHQIATAALARVGARHLAERTYATLSGGEKQRILIARALAQQATHLLLDEPTNHLDVRYQHGILELVRSIGVTIVIVLHDLNLAAPYCDELVLLHQGRVIYVGPPWQVLTPEVLEPVYDVAVRCLEDGNAVQLVSHWGRAGLDESVVLSEFHTSSWGRCAGPPWRRKIRAAPADIEPTDDQLNTLHKAGYDDGSFSVEPDGTVLGFFDREAPTEQDAVISAIVDVEHAVIGARVIRVQADDDWLTASEIAERVGRSRQSVALLARGERGPGDFPAPVARRRSSNPLWSWSEVEAWFERYEPKAVPAHGPRLSPDFLVEVNDRLDLRERLRHSPHAPWRPKLNEALPLGV